MKNYNNIGLFQEDIDFFKSSDITLSTFADYFKRLRKISLSIFEWVNLPDTMNERQLEKDLQRDGQAALLYDDKRGFINTKATDSGHIDIYNLPTLVNCNSIEYHEIRERFAGKLPAGKGSRKRKDEECILVWNDWEKYPTDYTLRLFAIRLAKCENIIDVNINSQKTPIMIVTNTNKKNSMLNLYRKYDGNEPVIFGTKDIDMNDIKAINTGAEYVADKIEERKRNIWNEALTFLGVNNLLEDKKERLISDEATSNNEVINYNLQSFLIPRKEACKLFNEKYNFTNTTNEISVRVRSDLANIIKTEMSTVKELISNNNKLEVGDINGKI